MVKPKSPLDRDWAVQALINAEMGIRGWVDRQCANVGMNSQ